MQRGDIRTAVLAVLTESPGHGYEIIQVIEAKSDGAWRPSPGSVYPTLQLLEDEGMVRSTEREGKRVFEITDEGRAEASERIEQAGGAPWDLAARAGGKQGELRRALGQLAVAAKQVGSAGSPEQVERAVAVLSEARKGMYGILAED